MIVVIQYKSLESLPPTMSLLLAIKGSGRKVIYIGLPSKSGEDFLRKHEIPYSFMPDFREFINHGKSLQAKILRRVKRLYAFVVQRRWIRKQLTKLAYENGVVTIWHSEVASAALIGDWVLRFRNRLITIYEMFDFRGANWWGFHLRKHLMSARLIVPEYNRAHILKESLRLPLLPAVIPNKPYEHPRSRNLPISDDYIRTVFSRIGDRPVFLYQGVWTEDREDVAKVVEIIARNRPHYCVVCMPECKESIRLGHEYKNVFSIPFISAPNHLIVTSHATVGLAIYNVWGESSLTRLNVVYCAPNKIYEYAGFGIPTLGSKLPGLEYTIGRYGAGICCDLNEEAILVAADELIQNYAQYKDSANRFFDDLDLDLSVRTILSPVDQL